MILLLSVVRDCFCCSEGTSLNTDLLTFHCLQWYGGWEGSQTVEEIHHAGLAISCKSQVSLICWIWLKLFEGGWYEKWKEHFVQLQWMWTGYSITCINCDVQLLDICGCHWTLLSVDRSNIGLVMASENKKSGACLFKQVHFFGTIWFSFLWALK